MAQFKNVSPLGALDIPALGRIVQADEVFEVPADLSRYFTAQPKNFEAVAKPKKEKAAATTPAEVSPAPGESDTSAVEAESGDDAVPGATVEPSPAPEVATATAEATTETIAPTGDDAAKEAPSNDGEQHSA